MLISLLFCLWLAVAVSIYRFLMKMTPCCERHAATDNGEDMPWWFCSLVAFFWPVSVPAVYLFTRLD